MMAEARLSCRATSWMGRLLVGWELRWWRFVGRDINPCDSRTNQIRRRDVAQETQARKIDLLCVREVARGDPREGV